MAIVDLASGRTLLHNADEVFPAASSIKIAVLAELYHQAEQAAAGASGKAALGDLYTMDAADVLDESPFLAGLTPGVSRVTNRDLASFMVTASDNGATNVLIARVGMDNVNALLARAGAEGDPPAPQDARPGRRARRGARTPPRRARWPPCSRRSTAAASSAPP